MRPFAITCLVALLAGPLLPARAGDAERGEVRTVQRVPVQALDAVRAARRACAGVAAGVGLEVGRHGHWFEVAMRRHGRARLVRVDDRSGKVLGVAAAHGEDAAVARRVRRLPVSLSDALQRALAAHPGHVLEAEAVTHGGPAWRVAIVNGGGVTNWRVDARSGMVSAATHTDPD